MKNEAKIELSNTELENEMLGVYLDDPDSCREWEDEIKPYLFSDRLNRIIAETVQNNISRKKRNTSAVIFARLGKMYPDKTDDLHKHFKMLNKIKTAPESLESTLDKLKDLALRRKGIETARKIIGLCEEESDIEKLEDLIRKESEELLLYKEPMRIKKVHDLATEYILNRKQETGSETGFEGLDKDIGGLHGGELLLIGAPSGVGKTTIALNIGLNLTQKKLGENANGLLFFSLEMTEEEVTDKIISCKTNIPLKQIREGAISEEQRAKIEFEIREVLCEQNILIDCANNTIDDIEKKAKVMMRKEPYSFLIVDYIQIIKSNKIMSNALRYEKLGEYSQRLKALAKDLKIPILILSQVNKNWEQGAEPNVGWIRESQNIVNDSDYILIVVPDKNHHGFADMHLVKARHAEKNKKYRLAIDGWRSKVWDTGENVPLYTDETVQKPEEKMEKKKARSKKVRQALDEISF